MFGIGPAEFFVIIVVAVLVLGPEHLPKVVRTFNKAMSEFRKVSTDFQRAINLEANQEEQRKTTKAAPRKTTTKATQAKKPASTTAQAKKNVQPEPEQKQAPKQEPAETSQKNTETTEG